MRAVRPAVVALLSIVALMTLISPRQAMAGVVEVPSATIAAPLPPGSAAEGPRATSLPGAEDAAQAAVNNTLMAAGIVLVSGVAGIVGLMRGRL